MNSIEYTFIKIIYLEVGEFARRPTAKTLLFIELVGVDES